MHKFIKVYLESIKESSLETSFLPSWEHYHETFWWCSLQVFPKYLLCVAFCKYLWNHQPITYLSSVVPCLLHLRSLFSSFNTCSYWSIVKSPFSMFVCVGLLFNTRLYWPPSLVRVSLLFQYSSILTLDTRLCWPSFSILIRIDPWHLSVLALFFNTRPHWSSRLIRVDLQHSSILILFFNTCLYWPPTLVCVDTFSFNTRPYWFSTLVHVGAFLFNTRLYWSLHSFVLISPFFNIRMYWPTTLVRVNSF